MCGANRLSVQLAPLLRGAVIRSARRWLPLYIPALVAFVTLAFPVAMSSSATAGCSGVGIEIGVPIPIIGSALVGSGGCKESTTEVHRREKQAVKPANSQEAEAPARPHKPKTLHKKSIVQNTAEPAKPHASKAARAAEINAKAHVRPHATLSAKAVLPAKAEPQPRQETRSQAPLDKKAVDPQLAAAKDAALAVLEEAARPLPTTTGDTLRAAIEATAHSLSEAIKQGSAELIHARTDILDGLLAEVKKAQNAPQPAIQISAARSSAAGQVAAAQNEPLQFTASPQRRVALVIGNSDYKNANPLANPGNDAKLMSAALAALDFEVIEGEDLDKRAMESKVREFVIKQADADVSLMFYAGHGMQVAGRNYLVPVDARLEDATAVNFETIDLDNVLGYMTGPKKVAIALLDACRDNPLAHRFANAVASRSIAVGHGLAMPSVQGGGLLIAFATAPGEVALDGTGENSPFTSALIKYLPVKGLEIQQLMTDVKADVYNATHGQQSPWHNSDLREAFFLNR